MRERDSIVVEEKKSGVLQKFGIYAAVLLVVFLLGFLPMWFQKREVSNQLTATQKQLERTEIRGLLMGAIVESRRGEYEPARAGTSEFFTRLRAEMDKNNDSAYSAEEREKLKNVYTDRDAIITMLAQRDQASAEKLTELYVIYQTAIGQPSPTTAASPATVQPAAQ